jgi:two-component system chemotaxis response regulator CheB
MLVGPDATVRLINTGAVPPARPSADLLLSTLAVALGPRAVAVVLTGGAATPPSAPKRSTPTAVRS